MLSRVGLRVQKRPSGRTVERAAAAQRLRVVWAPSRLRRVLRHRLVSALVAVVVVGAAGSVLSAELRAAAQAQADWGASVQVLMVSERVGAGDRIAGHVELVERPAAMVPIGAVDDPAQLGVGAQAAVDLVPGELLLAERVVGAGAASMPRGTLAVTVEIDGQAALVEAGDLVDLWSIDQATGAGTNVVAAVVVLDRHDDSLTVAVPEAHVEAVATASTRPFTIALRR